MREPWAWYFFRYAAIDFQKKGSGIQIGSVLYEGEIRVPKPMGLHLKRAPTACQLGVNMLRRDKLCIGVGYPTVDCYLNDGSRFLDFIPGWRGEGYFWADIRKLWSQIKWTKNC